MRGRSFAAILSLMGFLAPQLRGADGPRPFRYPEGTCNTGELRYINDVPVLTVCGTPEDMGTAVGISAARPGRKMLNYPEDVLRSYHLHFLWGTFLKTGKQMVDRFPEPYARELEAIAAVEEVDRNQIVAGNTLFDIKKTLACSAILVEPSRSSTGAPLVGRNLDYPSLGYAHKYSLVTIYKPNDARHVFASIGFPGLVGCLTGINDAGLTVAVLEALQTKSRYTRFDPRGTPYGLCYRRLLEECATIEEATALLAKMRRATMTNLILADWHHVAVAEVTPSRVVVRGPREGVCICTNHFCTEELRPVLALDISHTFQRYKILEKVASGGGPVTWTEIQMGLHAARNEEKTLQSMIIEPATLRLSLAIGCCPATAGTMRELDLGALFRAGNGRRIN